MLTSSLKRYKIYIYRYIKTARLGKLACPRVNDDPKKDVDDHKLDSGRPHDYWIFFRTFSSQY